jgi:hypothetical protein
MKLTMVVERGSYPKFLNALPAGSKAVEHGTDPQTGRVVLEVETSLANFPWEAVPGIIAIKPLT